MFVVAYTPAILFPTWNCSWVVLESMTKHLSGGACIGGVVVGKMNKKQPAEETQGAPEHSHSTPTPSTCANLMQALHDYVRIIGLLISTDTCRLFSQQLQQAMQRVRVTANASLQVALWLEELRKASDGLDSTANSIATTGPVSSRSDLVVQQIDFPLLPCHVSYEIASKHLM